MPIVASGQSGPIKYRIEAQGTALALYKTAERNRMVRNSLRRGGVFWLGFYLAKRFSMYSKIILGYPNITKRWAITKARKLGIVVPFMGLRGIGDPTKMVIAATVGGRASAIATATKGEIRITVPYGHPIPEQYSAAFRTIPTKEVQDIADEVAIGLAAELAGNPLTDENRKKTPKPRVVGASRARTPGRMRPYATRGRRAA